MPSIDTFLKAIRIPSIAILIGFLSSLSLSAQNISIQSEKKQDIISLYNQKKYYNVLTELDWYHDRYPSDLYFFLGMRLDIWIKLNDMIHLKNDLIKMQYAYPGFIAEYPEFKVLTDEKYFAEMGAKEFVTDPVLDPDRDYKLKLTICDTIRGSLSPARSCYDVKFYDLKLNVDPDKKQIAGTNKIFFNVIETTNLIQLDLFDNYEIHALQMDGLELEYERRCQAIFIKFPDPLMPGENRCIELSYSGIPIEAKNPPWNGGFVWEKNKKRPWVGVACENLGASSWWPVKDHLSDKPDSVRITISVPGTSQVIANGNLRSVRLNDDKTTSYEWFVSYPINSYNVTFYIGDFVNFNESYKSDIESYQVDYYVLKSNLKKATKYYSQTHLILETFGEIFGPYAFPADGAGYVEAPYKGMEHQGAIAIGDAYDKYRREEVCKDRDLLLVHETAHEWWGNAVAVGDMADAWINEGFGTYAEYLFLEKVYGYQKYLDAFGIYSRNIMNRWPMVGESDVNDNTFLSGDIYFKGAAMLNNLRCIMNDDTLFFSIIKGFYEDRRMKISATDDFILYVRKKYPEDLGDFFDAFLYQADPPVLSYSFALLQGTLVFNYAWTGVARDFTMPFSIMVNNSNCIRLNGTTSAQTYTCKEASSFYIPNPFNFDSKVLDPNAFTYFQTCIIRE
jgi:aminopeptidase N